MSPEGEIIENFIKLCRRENIEPTPDLVVVYNVLLKSGKALTPDEIYSESVRRYPVLSFTDVRDALRILERLGAAVRLSCNGNTGKYIFGVVHRRIL